MALSSSINYKSYVAAVDQTVFPFTEILYFNESHLEVWVNGVKKTLGSDYTCWPQVNTSNGDPGGTITFLAGMVGGEVVLIKRVVPLTQTTDYQENEKFPAETHEQGLDRVTMICQQLNEESLRSVKLPVAETGTSASTLLPALSSRANKYAAWNASGEFISLDAATASGTSVLATGSTTARFLADRFAEQFHVADYGAVGDGVTDDAPFIQDAIDAAGAAGGGTVVFGPNSYAIGSMLTVPQSNTVLVGSGADRRHDVGSQGALAATTLKWIGAASGTMVDIYSPDGASNPKHSGSGIQKIYFEANGAGYGVKIRSQYAGRYENLHFNEFATAAIYLGTVTTLGEDRNPQENLFSVITSNNITTNGAFCLLEGDTGATPSANVSMNTFIRCTAVHKNGDAYVLKNSDQNHFYHCRSIRAGGGTGNAVVFHGNSVSDKVARHNVFIGFAVGTNAPIVAKGTSSYTYASYNNSMLLVDKGNATPNPTIETGATLWYTTDEHVSWKQACFQMAVSDAYATAKTERDALATESLRVRNNSANHIVIADQHSNEWGFDIDGADGNLRIRRIAGTGLLNLPLHGTRTLAVSTSPVTLAAGHGVILVDASGGNRTVTLPLAADYPTGYGAHMSIRRTDASGNTVTIQRQSADTLNGGTSETLAANTGKIYVCDQVSAWYSF